MKKKNESYSENIRSPVMKPEPSQYEARKVHIQSQQLVIKSIRYIYISFFYPVDITICRAWFIGVTNL